MDQRKTWVNIPNYGDIYQVSKFGMIRSIPRFVRCQNGFRLNRGKILKPGLSSNGYLVVTLYKPHNRKGVNKLVHRLVAKAFVKGETINRSEVNHIDGNKMNCRWENLEWVTTKENHKHATSLGLHKNQKANLNWRKIEIIRMMAKSKKYTFRYIGQRFKISGTSVRDITQNKYWKEGE